MSIPATLFGAVGMVYGILLPVIILQILAVLFIPSMLHGSHKPHALGKAIYCYMMQALGILLMTAGGIPILYGVLAMVGYGSGVYLSLLLIFASGGVTFLLHDSLVQKVDAATRAVPHALYWYTFKFLGYAITLVALLSFFISLLLGGQPFADRTWVMPIILMLYGLLLGGATRDELLHGKWNGKKK